MANHARDAKGTKGARGADAQQSGYGWLDDAFDDEKQAEELQRAQASRNIGCLVGALVIVAIVVILAVVGCGVLASFTV